MAATTSACASRPPRRCRRASPRRRSPDAARSPSGVSAASSGIRSPTCFANSSLSLRMTWRMIRVRSRPPPRGPLRISSETRAATPSKNAQACLQERDLALELGLVHRPMLGRGGRERDAPEVDRTGADPVLHDLERPGGVELARHPGEVRDRPIALPIRLERLQGDLGALRAPIPARPVESEGHRLLVLGPVFDDRANRHGRSSSRSDHISHRRRYPSEFNTRAGTRSGPYPAMLPRRWPPSRGCELVRARPRCLMFSARRASSMNPSTKRSASPENAWSLSCWVSPEAGLTTSS